MSVIVELGKKRAWINSKLKYVDKTLLIRDLIDDQVPVILFTRPRRFGKTLALNMLKTFFEKTKEDTSIYFKDKQIWRFEEYIIQGFYPGSGEQWMAMSWQDLKKHCI